MLLRSFAWGEEFFKINLDLLEQYSACETGQQVLEVQNRMIQAMEARVERKKELSAMPVDESDPYGMSAHLPPQDSDEYEDEEEEEEEEEEA